MDVSTLRINFPEFADENIYTDPMITFWMGIAVKQLIQIRWADLYDEGIQLCTAHYLAMAVANQKAAAAGGVGGSSSGVISGESAGSVSVNYDTQAAIEPNAGHWNLTSYGTTFIRLARMVGMGGYQC